MKTEPGSFAQSVAAEVQPNDHIHAQIVKNYSKVEEWFRKHRREIDVPFYSSFDIRDSGLKVANIDANIFPAGFNNICPTDRENCSPLIERYVRRHYGEAVKRLLLLTEEHTANPYYWDNVATLLELIEQAGLEVKVAIPRLPEAKTFRQSASRGQVEVFAARIEAGRISIDGYEPDLVISNNDFSESYQEWGPHLNSKLNPPRELGWYQRKKSTYFKNYNLLCREFAGVIGVDPWLLTVETELFSDFDIGDDGSRKRLATKVDEMIERLKKQDHDRGIQEPPFVFVKNNSGTYGLGVMRVQSGEEVLQLNNKSRKKMKAAKGGKDIQEVIIQEGIRSVVRSEGVMAEPTVYLLGCQLAGGFLRTHADKDETESLNSPGAVYKRLCVSDLKISVEGHPMENVYGWLAKIGLLAIGREGLEMNVPYTGYSRWSQACDREN